MCRIKVTQWVNQYCHANRKDEDYDHVRDFLLLWSLYEFKLFNCEFTIAEMERKVDDLINQNRLNHTSFLSVFQYFQQRYTTSGTINNRFSKLLINNQNHKQVVESTLCDSNPSLRDQIFASAIIVYRFRNNLFHGIKDITQINYQKSNFDNANEFIIRMLEA
jgi:hypothetical protein